MKIKRKKLDLVLAEQCKNLTELTGCGFSSATLTRIRQGLDVTTKTAGRLSQTLDVPLERLLETKEVSTDEA